MKKKDYIVFLLFLIFSWSIVFFHFISENQILKKQNQFNLDVIEELQTKNYEINFKLYQKTIENEKLKLKIEKVEKILETKTISRSSLSITLTPTPTPIPIPTLKPTPFTIKSQTDLELLARIIYCEAGSVGETDQLAVGQVILNRSKELKLTLKETIYQKNSNGIYVFSPVASSSYSYRKYSKESEEIARRLLNGEIFKPVGQALYFCTIKAYNSGGWHYQYVASGKGFITFKSDFVIYID